MNWGWLVVRFGVALAVLTLLVLSQGFWHKTVWRVTARFGNATARRAVRLAWLAGLGLMLFAFLQTIFVRREGHVHIFTMANALAGLWFTSALFGYLAVNLIRGVDWVWTRLRGAAAASGNSPSTATANSDDSLAAAEAPADPSRRYFFKTATVLAGATPFIGAVYGFAAERLNYQVREIDLPVANLPPALDRMTIAQLSDIHRSGYMPRAEVRRAVGMANELGADLTVVTGDFITTASDPLEDCIQELAALRAPLGVWGCNGNHEIYADAEAETQRLFAKYGMTLLRRQNAEVAFREAKFNLIGVDYQRERTPSGRKTEMLADVGALVRRDVPNILLSHNPNTFRRAAELGIEVSLAGHTHGGQIQVEILDHRLSPARFMTDYIAGAYQRLLRAPANEIFPPQTTSLNSAIAAHSERPLATLYVNRGLGTVGAPVRLGVPPEISLLRLRRA